MARRAATAAPPPASSPATRTRTHSAHTSLSRSHRSRPTQKRGCRCSCVSWWRMVIAAGDGDLRVEDGGRVARGVGRRGERLRQTNDRGTRACPEPEEE
eukprot:2360331-Pleurochrysis_carterae.AAC.1